MVDTVKQVCVRLNTTPDIVASAVFLFAVETLSGYYPEWQDSDLWLAAFDSLGHDAQQDYVTKAKAKYCVG